jgi:hypothetical protein
MTYTNKGELSDLNLTNNQWHYVENASNGGLRFSLSEAGERGEDDFYEAIRQELAKRSNAPHFVSEAKSGEVGG